VFVGFLSVTMSSSFVTSTKTSRTIKSSGGGGGFDDDMVSSKSSRHQVYRGMSPTTSNRLEVCVYAMVPTISSALFDFGAAMWHICINQAL